MRRLALSVLLIACRPAEPAAQQGVSIVGAPSDAPAPIAAPTSAAGPDASAPSPRRIEHVALAIEDAPSDARPLLAGKPLVLPGDYADRIESPPRWLVRTGNRKISVVDRDSGKVLGAIDEAYPDDVQRKHARLPGWHGAARAPSLLLLADGRVRTPRARLSDGKKVTVERLLTSDASDDVFVMGRDAQKKRWLGAWNLDAGDDVVLDRASPVDSRSVKFDPTAKSFVVFVASSGEGPSGPDDCVAAFFDGKRSECFRTGRDGSSVDRSVLTGGFIAGFEALVDTQAQREVRSTLVRPMVTAALDTPPRAMFVMNDGTLDPQRKTVRRKFEILAPEGTFGTFHLDIAADFENSFHSAHGETADPIVAEQGISLVPKDVAGAASAAFIDLERGRVIRLPTAVDTLTRGTVPRRFLAVERAKPNDKLVFVDLDSTKAFRIGTMPACPGPYWPSVEKNGVLALVCSKQPKPDLFSFVRLWSEVVEVASMKRWHVDGEVVDAWPTGEIVRSAPGSVMSEGASSPRGGVRVVRLQ